MTAQGAQQQIDPARRLFQVRLALGLMFLPREHRDGLEELAWNLEKKLTKPATRAQKGN